MDDGSLNRQGNPHRWVLPSVDAIIEAALVFALLLWVSYEVLYPALRESLTWRYHHDTPIMLYLGFLMERFGFLPYRDFFDMNMLGSYLSYQWIGRYFGFDDAGVRMADVTLILVLMASTAAMVWRLGLRAAWAAALLVALSYLREGGGTTLQREFIGLIPVALGVAFATALPFLHSQWRAWLSGLAFGVAATIKPHLVLAMPFIVFYLASDQERDGRTPKDWLLAVIWNGIMGGLGMALPLLAFLGYLVYHGILENFVDSALGYVPLYAAMTGDHRVLDPADRPMYLFEQILKLGGRWVVFAMGAAGLCAAMGNPRLNPGQRRVAALVAALLLAYMTYPVFSGQFWNYHYLPMVFVLCVGGGLAFAPSGPTAPWAQRIIPAAIVLFCCTSLFQPHHGFAPVFRAEDVNPKNGRVDRMAAFLKENLKPGDTVQPLDWADGGIAHAMLYAEARIATPFIYYFHFFHHPDDPYIVNLRKRFMTALNESQPRYIIQWIPTRAGWVVPGKYTARDFPEAESLLRTSYHQVESGSGYKIYERNAEATLTP